MAINGNADHTGLTGFAPRLNIADNELIAKTKPRIEWTLKSRRPDGYFGPAKDYSPEPGIQRYSSMTYG
ncbi:MAG: hypothetical protein ACXVJD_05665 [Mucilaginibacter sp.]